MSLTWANLDQLARRSAYAKITDALLGMTEQERLAFAPQFEAGVKGTRGESWWGRGDHPGGGFALAAIACLPTAARAAAVLGRRDVQDEWHNVPARFWQRIVDARGLDWLPDLGVRLAGRLPARDVGAAQWQFVARLLDGHPELAPRTEGFVRGWLAAMHDAFGPCHPFAERLRESPYLDLLLPSVFEIDGMGGELVGGQWTTGGWAAKAPFAEAVVQLVADGRLDRATVLAATLDRLVRGDRPGRLRPFTELHDALDPTLDEMTAAAGDYAGLLAGAPSPVAGTAQRALRAVDEAGRLEFETFLETSAATLLRPEKGLVKTQLSWLEKVGRRQPERAGEVLETVAVAFGHPALDVQERALTLIGKQLSRVDAATVARIVDAAGALTGDLPGRAAELFGTAAPAPSAESGLGIPARPAPPAAMPPPIASAAELAAETVALLHTETGVGWERVLAALVSLPADGLADALKPVLDRHDHALSVQNWYGNALRAGHLGDVLRRVVTPEVFGLRQRIGERTSVLDSVLVMRVREIADRITAKPIAELLATPTRVDGSLDPAVLLERLIRLEATGGEPWPLDFEQALLRLPRTVDDDVVTRAAELTSTAGRRFAAWLREGGLPDPVSTRRVQRNMINRHVDSGMNQDHRRIITDLVPARVTGEPLSLEERLLTVDRGRYITWFAADFPEPADIGTMVLPHHREVLAAWALPTLAGAADVEQRGAGRPLPLIAECAGPVGPAVHLGVAYVLGAKDETDRLAAVDAFLVLAAEEHDLSGVGTDVAELCQAGMLKLTRVLPGLTDAHRAGASVAVWQVLTAALPILLPLNPRGLPDLLALATVVAGPAGAAGDVPGLAEAAAKPGSSRLVKEARRLRAVLQG